MCSGRSTSSARRWCSEAGTTPISTAIRASQHSPRRWTPGGALFALHHDLGWDARHADIIVGTSAGSIVGTLLRAGVAPEDLAAWATGASPTGGGTKFRDLMRQVDEVSSSRRLPVPTMPGRVALRALAHPTQLGAALTSLLPNGVHDHGQRLTIMDPLLGSWPTRQLWISAVRVGDGRLTWFKQHHSIQHVGPGDHVDVNGSVQVTPSQAVAASCAIPFLARPVRIGQHRYVDGGVRSPTNADVLAGHQLDLIVVLSPMGGAFDGVSRSPARHLAQRRLEQELRVLRTLDVPVQVVGPDITTLRAMGWNLLDRSNTAAVMRGAFLGAVGQLDTSATDILPRRRDQLLPLAH
jgi:NTE family protein